MLKFNMKKLVYFFVLTLIIVLLLSVFIFKQTSQKPNIILISIDTLRRDHVGIYGYKKNTTPTIDNIAKEGIYFENAFSASSWTLPAHMSMFTGLPPSIHSVEEKTNTLSKDIQTVTQLIKLKKYKTAAIVTLLFVSSKYGFDAGFDKFFERFKKKADIITDNALGWLKKNNNQPFFLFLHYWDAHWPYLPPEKYAEMFGVNTKNTRWRKWGRLQFLRKYSDPRIPMSENVKKNVIALYDGEIRNVDYNINRIITYLKKKDIYNNTIFVITSDHGEEFKEHNSFGHGHSLYSEVINVPLIIRFPSKIKSGLKIREPVITSDIPLTLLNLLKIKPPTQFKKYSINLEQYFTGSLKNTIKDRKIFVESKLGSGPNRFAIIKRNHKYFASYKFHSLIKNYQWIQIPESLYDILKDPGDLKNLISTGVSMRGGGISIQRNLKSSLNRYISKNVKGIQLVFMPPSRLPVKSITYTGYVQFDYDLEDRPFGVNFSNLDFIDVEEIDGHFKFSICVKSSSKRIYLPISNRTKEIEINISQSDKMLIQKLVLPPKMNKSIQLVPETKYNGEIYLKGDISSTTREKVSISDKEKKMLETLGYI